LADGNREIFSEKGKIGKIFHEFEFLSEIGENLKQGEMHHCLIGYGRSFHFARKLFKIASVSGAEPQTPLEELTMLPQTL